MSIVGTHVARWQKLPMWQSTIPSSPSAWPLCSDVLMSTQSPAQCHREATHQPDAALVDDAAAGLGLREKQAQSLKSNICACGGSVFLSGSLMLLSRGT